MFYVGDFSSISDLFYVDQSFFPKRLSKRKENLSIIRNVKRPISVMFLSDGENSDEEEKEEPDVDKQMGDLEGQDGDKLDEQIWGDDEDENDKDQSEEKKEEFGSGAGQETESEMVAKDDNEDDSGGKDDKKKNEEKQEEEEENTSEEKEQQPHNMEDIDEVLNQNFYFLYLCMRLYPSLSSFFFLYSAQEVFK